MRVFLITVFITALICGCKPKQSAVPKPASPTPQVPSATGDEIQALNNLVISFYSTGEGANQKAVEAIENFIKEYSEKYKRLVQYGKIAWGREGEVDFCISLTDLDEQQKKMFVNDMRRMVKQFELIHFHENHPCRQLK